ncbi:Protein of unknown function DUF2103, metal-binding [Acididesulfobacillus acetoxydans]|uniref:Predicted metal-binding protein (DUF2103) n=1 Tax=Acididesulfobacillus acetoxydans TaxID=1561005 RepID=A0A8S0W7V3_9FIRM|nr:DUF2103 domain-containing protein [Acididesulfobacillus acetoxydans]CAA7601169.1 Protein of unknown function DUF2103, metal-binding [Acididesulfobacillus acetoxydans]CEJ08552.1 Predicted metal-binding protein (DUF2103) [Acididesulfobacillus acetoxydans]
MKYRRNKVKREHGIIQDALAWLEELSQYPEVSDIIPGVIEISRSPERGVVYKYQTQTGCKLLLKSNGSIQEAFVVTKNPAWVRDWVEKRWGPEPGKRSGPDPSPVPREGRNSAGERNPELRVNSGSKGKSESKENPGFKADPESGANSESKANSGSKGDSGAKANLGLGAKPDRARKFGREEKFSKSRSERPEKPGSGRNYGRTRGQAKRPRSQAVRLCQARPGKAKQPGGVWASAGDQEAANVGRRLDPAAARALRTLQKQLEDGKGTTEKKKR